MSAYIKLTNVSKTFGKQTVLQPVTMELEEGKIHGMIGRNGSGKTVLMKMILGILRPTTGTVEVNGKIVGKDMDFPAETGAIIETIEFIPFLNAYQKLADIAAVKGKLSKQQIKDVLKLVGLEKTGRKHVAKFSVGMKQRLAIAQAIMESPKLLILDEPMNGMDQSGVEEVRALIRKKREEGTTIILSSHNSEDIRLLCDYVYRIDGGVIRKEETCI